MFSMPAGSEWLIILVIVLIFFGAGKLPDVLKQMGKGVKEFKDASRGDEENDAPVRQAKNAPRQLPTDELDEEMQTPRSKSRVE